MTSRAPGPHPRRRHRAGALATAVLVLVALAGVVELAFDVFGASRPPTIDGVRLGMTPDQVRERLSLADVTTSLEGGDLVLRSGSTALSFHEGMLVALTTRRPAGHPASNGDPLELTPGTLLEREPIAGEGVELTMMSRTCPTHAAEVARILRAHGH